MVDDTSNGSGGSGAATNGSTLTVAASSSGGSNSAGGTKAASNGTGGAAGGDGSTGAGGVSSKSSSTGGAAGADGDSECESNGPGCKPEVEPSCGDGSVDEGEECDDGNAKSGDSCTAKCKTDSDNDTVEDTVDNCPSIPNPDQIDATQTGIGDACEGPDGFMFCASEGERCEFEGTAYVAFGAEGGYIYAYNVDDGIQCANPDPIAGPDPAPNLAKSCYYKLGDCVPQCGGKVCGDDGCGGLCGTCDEGRLCSSDQATCELDPNRWFHLQSQFLGDTKCLESNDRENGTVHEGFSFMDDCSGAGGQRWRFVKDGSWYRLKSEFQGDGKCLESNNPDDLGAAFMDDCADVSGQHWQLVPDGSWYRLKSEFQGDGRCLESNDPTNDTAETFGGNAFMDDCASVSGQMWRLVPD